MNAVVFLGPSAPAEYARAQGIDVRPPARMGDVYDAALGRPDVIGIVDGLFEHVPAVWHKEVLFALSQTIPVIGGGSMGALRACELDSFGMTGIGRIYRDFRDGTITDDDEVAVVHAPREDGYRVLSEAMVNIRFGLEAARRDGVLDERQYALLVADAKRCFYPDRSWHRVCDRLAIEAGAPAAAALQDFLDAGFFDLKRLDAMAVIDAVAARARSDAPAPAADFEFEWTWHWEQGVVRRRPPAGDAPDHGAPRPDTREPAAERALLYHLAERELAAAGVHDDAPTALAEFRLARGLGSVGPFHAWLRDNRLDPQECLALARREAAVRRLLRDRSAAINPLLPIVRRLDDLTADPMPPAPRRTDPEGGHA